jgi:copper chaperone NosL
MKNGKLTIWTRVLMLICGIILVAVLLTPMWRIELNAPQYPEGLTLNIHANGIRGNVDIINGLNHYIGMKTLHNEDFPEFRILPFCIGFFIVLFLLVALLNKRKWFYTSFFLFVAFGVIAMVDFWRWEYNYGHNLDPHAAIVVPGMAYQPPLIGFKQLLNFGAYSIPDTGGWIFVGCGVILLLCIFLEWRNAAKLKKLTPAALILMPLVLLLSSCSSGPEAIKTGVDNCVYCKMTISDTRFGAEIVSGTGKTYKFDDILCMQKYYETMDANFKQKAIIYLTDFCGNHQLIEAKKSLLLQSNTLKCPMDGHVAAFSNSDSMQVVRTIYPGEKIDLSLGK